MNYPLRSIAYIAELIHPPARHSSDALQKIHNVVFNDAESCYQNFQVVPGGAQLINPTPQDNIFSCCTILQDRIQIREEMTGIARDDFRSRVLRLAQIAVSNLNIPVFVVRQIVVRSLINPKYTVDSREFISRAVFKMDKDDFEPLQRPPDLMGLRLAYNPTSAAEGIYNIRLESYTQDPRSLFIENVASFRTPVVMNNLESLGDDFDSAYSYIEKYIVPFVARFDTAP